jgi:hypothetical protein
MHVALLVAAGLVLFAAAAAALERRSPDPGVS